VGATIIVGGFFGDEGKGKIVAHIAHRNEPSIIARGGVGPNAYRREGQGKARR